MEEKDELEQAKQLKRQRWSAPMKFRGIVNIQISINRAVWAYNLEAPGHSRFKTEADRDAYIKACLVDAKKELEQVLKRVK